MEDGLGADVANSQTVRVRPLSRVGVGDARPPEADSQDPDEIGWYHDASVPLHRGWKLFYYNTHSGLLYMVTLQEKFIMSIK